MKTLGGAEGQAARSDTGVRSGVSDAMSRPCHTPGLWLDFHVAPPYVTPTYLFCGGSSGLSPTPQLPSFHFPTPPEQIPKAAQAPGSFSSLPLVSWL